MVEIPKPKRRKWQRHDRVINILGEIGTVQRRVTRCTVLVEYDGRRGVRQRGIAYDSALRQPWKEHDPKLGHGYFSRLHTVEPNATDSGAPLK